ncbi:MAG TPA: hypothetical protein VE177_04660 [Candidatus Binatus sp.]|nr:hypothetical protein [Candidatus Binatus sp.]
MKTVRVELPDPPRANDTVVGLNEARKLVDEDVTVRLTLPASPALLTVRDDVPDLPARSTRLVGEDASVKLPVRVKSRKPDRVTVPLEAAIVTLYRPGRVEVDVEMRRLTKRDWPGDMDRVVTLNENVGPAGDIVPFKLTTPEKPVLEIERVVDVEPPESNLFCVSEPIVSV